MTNSPSHSDDQAIAAESAIDVLTQAQAILSERLASLAPTDDVARAAMESKARELYALQQSIRVEDERGVRSILDLWGPRVKDEQRFWREI